MILTLIFTNNVMKIANRSNRAYFAIASFMHVAEDD